MCRILAGLLPLAASLLCAAGCDGGLAPPAPESPGAIRGVVHYAPPDAWPAADSLRDLRFVAMRFVPRDTADFLNLNALVFNEPRLAFNVARDTFFIPNVAPGLYLYSGVAQKFGPAITQWRPVGLFETDGGIFRVRPGDTVGVEVRVDFRNPPPFPPR